ncbi:MAG: DUF4126 domain-containing protein [Geitlerinemataceae cyanobacterium]
MLEILAVLSASAAVGLRIGLPLLLIGLLRSNLWYDVPLLSQLSPRLVIGVLVSWSLFELLASKQLLGQRILQVIELIFSPIVGAIMGMAIASAAGLEKWQVNLLGSIGGLFALVLQLVQIGWFFRLRGLPLWAILAQDLLCILLVFFAFDAPQQGGLIALILLWLAIRSSTAWYDWYVKRGKARIMR